MLETVRDTYAATVAVGVPGDSSLPATVVPVPAIDERLVYVMRCGPATTVPEAGDQSSDATGIVVSPTAIGTSVVEPPPSQYTRVRTGARSVATARLRAVL